MPKKKKSPRRPRRARHNVNVNADAPALTERQRALAVTDGLLRLPRPSPTSAPPTGLHMTVACAGGSEVSLETESNLTRAAVLYADHVTVMSPRASMFMGLHELETGGPATILSVLESLPPGFASDSETVQQGIALTRAVNDPALLVGLTPQERQQVTAARQELDAVLVAATEELRVQARSLAEDAGADQLHAARRAGLVTVDSLTPGPGDREQLDALRAIIGQPATLESSASNMIEVLSARVFGLLSNGRALPVFDDEIASMVHARLREDSAGREIHDRDRPETCTSWGAGCRPHSILAGVPARRHVGDHRHSQ